MPKSLRTFDVMFLQYVCHGWQAKNIAVFMLDKQLDAVAMRFTSDWEGFDHIDLGIASALAEDLFAKAQDLGASTLVSYMQATLSSTMRITEPWVIRTDDVERELDAFQEQLIGNGASVVVRTSAQISSPPPSQAWQLRKKTSWYWDLLDVGPIRRHFWFAEAMHATAGAAMVTIVFAAGVSTFRTSRPVATTTSRPNVAAVMIQPPADLPLRRVLIPARLSSADLHLRMRARRSASPSADEVIEVAAFTAPERISEPPEVSMLVPDDMPMVQAETTWPYTAEDTDLPLPPIDSPKRVIRILQAFAAPFRKIGHVFSE